MPQTRYIKYVPDPVTMKRIGKIHVRLYELSGGLVGGHLDGLDILLLTTTGKKTGLSRTVPLPFFRDAGRYVLVASYGGNPQNPAWFNNLVANPRVTLQVGPKRFQARAHVSDEAERSLIWGQITYEFPRYLEYQKKTARQIPIVVLEPVR